MNSEPHLERGDGAFRAALLDGLGTQDGVIGTDLTPVEISRGLQDIVSHAKTHIPDLRALAINSFEHLDQALKDHSSALGLSHFDLSGVALNSTQRTLLNFMALKFEHLGKCFGVSRDTTTEINDLSASLFTSSLLREGKQVYEVYTLVRELLREQGLCILSDAQKAHPDLPACGLYSKITVQNFYEVLQSEGAQLLIARNDDKCFGACIYHTRGNCASEDREYFDRAGRKLQKPRFSRQIEDHFGEKFDPASCATTYCAFLSPLIREEAVKGGGETKRSMVYDAFIYHMLDELAHLPNRPKWMMGWVRTFPNPNEAETAHKRCGFYDTGIEMPYSKDSNLRLKLLLINLDQVPIHGEHHNEFASKNTSSAYIKESIEPNWGRMRDSAASLHYVDWDHV